MLAAAGLPPEAVPVPRSTKLPAKPALLALVLGLAACQPNIAARLPGSPASNGVTVNDAQPDPSVAQALRDRNWAQARALAARGADPLAPELVDWLRLQTPDAASATEIAAFLDTHAGWPGRSVLTARLSQALAGEHDPSVLRALCSGARLAATTPSLATLTACGSALTPADAGFAALLRQAWISGLGRPEDARAFLARWAGVVTPGDDAARFDALLARNALPAADEMSGRVDAARQLRLALRRTPATAITAAQSFVAQSFSARGNADPALLRDLARALHRQGNLDAAIALWSGPAAALSDASAGAERGALARDLFSAGREAEARRIADPASISDRTARAELLSLGGWMAWRMHDIAAANVAFAALARTARAPASLAHAHYWLARTSTDRATIEAEDQAASLYPTTFYGQLALARRLNGDAAPAFDPFTTAGLRSAAAMRFSAELARALAALPQPQWTRAQALDFATRPFARATALLVGWEQTVPARGFLLRIAIDDTDPVTRAMAASEALHLGLPEAAVAISRMVGREGVPLLDPGWPSPWPVPGDPALPPGLVAGLIRQESSFDTQASSPAGARGLMQLLPGTANEIARRDPQAGVIPPVSVAMLLDAPQVNIALGEAYLAGLVNRFSGSLPVAVAAYNAGPHRLDLWLGSPMPGPLPSGGEQVVVDWIEAIPFRETRDYVQYVLANAAVYRAHRGGRP